MASALKQTTYWYKIGKKTVTKAEYNKYENPVGDGPTKTTNDPDASGRKAEIADARSKNKASKRPTALTEAQTKLKDQGTKLPPKQPPFNYNKTPLSFRSPAKQTLRVPKRPDLETNKKTNAVISQGSENSTKTKRLDKPTVKQNRVPFYNAALGAVNYVKKKISPR